MAYGAHARRVDAKSTGLVEDVDMYKLGMVIKAERGIAGMLKGIYSYGQFEKRCGSYLSGYFGAYVAKTFFDTLNSDVRVEMKVLNFIDAGATNAHNHIQNTAHDGLILHAGYFGDEDKSAFGNKIGYKLTKTEKMKYTLSSNIAITGATAILTSVEGLAVGMNVRLADGTVNEVKKIVTLDASTKTITFSALANVAAMTVANTVVTRIDYKWEFAIKGTSGVWDKKESYDDVPFELNSALLIQRLELESSYVYAESATIVEVDAAALLVEKTDWTAFAGGADGSAPDAADYNTLAAGFDDEEITLLLSPELSTSAHNANMLALANDGYKYLYYVNVIDGATEDSLMNFGGSLKSTYTFGMIPMDKWFQMNNPLNPTTLIDIPNVGIAAAHYFNTYSQYGPKKVAAGYRDKVNTALLPIENDLRHNDKEGMGDLLIRQYGVNIGQWKSGEGTMINSARSLSNDAGYRFQNQLVGYLLLRRSILKYLQSIEQDPSGVAAQEQHYMAVWTYLKRKYDEGLFYVGQKEDGSKTSMDDVVTIVNDFSINTLANIANGIEEMFVEVKFVPPIEEPILDLASAPVTSI